jgi:hypothetical protein
VIRAINHSSHSSLTILNTDQTECDPALSLSRHDDRPAIYCKTKEMANVTYIQEIVLSKIKVNTHMPYTTSDPLSMTDFYRDCYGVMLRTHATTEGHGTG